MAILVEKNHRFSGELSPLIWHIVSTLENSRFKRLFSSSMDMSKERKTARIRVPTASGLLATLFLAFDCPGGNPIWL
jgi:hypothetical protein